MSAARVGRLGRRRTWMAAAGLVGAAIVVPLQLANASPDPCPVATTSTTNPCLPNSKFESGDGNKARNYYDPTAPATATAGIDWANAAGASVNYVDTPDEFAGSSTGLPDNSFGQGAKEDIANPTIVSGSIPKNKSDLTHFYTAYETKPAPTSNHTFLYLGWERNNTLGNADMDFEFNQNPTHTYANPTSGGTPPRTNGDILVTFDFPGSGNPVLSMLKWTTSASKSGTATAADCFSANTLPCWGQGSLGNLSNAGIVEANAGVLGDGTFGEAGIDLTAAGAFASTGCTTFGDGLLKSRSSSSFTAEIKDYVQIPPRTISVSNCGRIIIEKVDDATPPVAVADATFALYSDSAYANPVLDGSTKLATAVTTTDGTSITVADASKLPGVVGFLVKVDAELMRVTSISGNQLTVERGAADAAGATTSTTHAVDTAVTAVASCTTTGSVALTGGGTGARCTIANLFYASYYPVETRTPAGYQSATGIPAAPLTSSNSPLTVQVIDPRAPSSIKVVKVDDASNPLSGAVFKLYNDNTAHSLSSPVSPAITCTTKFPVGSSSSPAATTNAEVGTCLLSGIVVAGDYIVHEETPPAGFDAAADQRLTVALGASYSPGTPSTYTTFVDSRRYTVMVVVCRESDHSLYSSSVALTPPTPAPTPLPKTPTAPASSATKLGTDGPTEAQLCGATGLASVTGTTVYPGKHAGSHNAAIAIPTAQPAP